MTHSAASAKAAISASTSKSQSNPLSDGGAIAALAGGDWREVGHLTRQ